ncbi:hypothetical protein ACFPN7_18525 [Amycolatopsis halotolerans]|uniref:hypothetical protein n=1 Tax=Amycolatopsis halotolerans TaxID=330083 RepID=UPI00361C027B
MASLCGSAAGRPSARGRVAGWPGGRVAGWPGGRVAGWPGGRVAGWPGGLGVERLRGPGWLVRLGGWATIGSGGRGLGGRMDWAPNGLRGPGWLADCLIERLGGLGPEEPGSDGCLRAGRMAWRREVRLVEGTPVQPNDPASSSDSARRRIVRRRRVARMVR